MTMDNDLIKQMEEESQKRDPMIPRTVRFNPELDEELHAFAEERGLDFSVVVRAIMHTGWTHFKNS